MTDHSKNSTEREALASLICDGFPHAGGGSQIVWEDALPVADHVLAAGFHRTPTPPTEGASAVTTWAVGARVQNADGFLATISEINRDGWASLTWDDGFTDEMPFAYDPGSLTVLTPAPIDREALVEAIVEAIEDDAAMGMSTESIVRRAIEGVRRG